MLRRATGSSVASGALALVAAIVLLAPATARSEVRVDLGADYWFRPDVGDLNLTLAVDGELTRHFRVGGRFGALLTSGPEVGAPLDLDMRLVLARGRVYVEGLVGPWLFFGPEDRLFHLHGAIGFGLASSSFEFGLEVGAVDSSALAGFRLGFRL